MLATSMGHWYWMPLGLLGSVYTSSQGCPPKKQKGVAVIHSSHTPFVQGFPMECYAHSLTPTSGLHMHKCQALLQASQMNE